MNFIEVSFILFRTGKIVRHRVSYLSSSVVMLPHKEALYQLSLTITGLAAVPSLWTRHMRRQRDAQVLTLGTIQQLGEAAEDNAHDWLLATAVLNRDQRCLNCTGLPASGRLFSLTLCRTWICYYVDVLLVSVSWRLQHGSHHEHGWCVQSIS